MGKCCMMVVVHDGKDVSYSWKRTYFQGIRGRKHEIGEKIQHNRHSVREPFRAADALRRSGFKLRIYAPLGQYHLIEHGLRDWIGNVNYNYMLVTSMAF